MENMDKHWTIFVSGSIRGSDDILAYTPTYLSSASADNLVLYHTDVIHISITCINKLNFRSTEYADPVTVLAEPPSTEEAFVRVIPHQYSYFIPRDSSQSQGMDLSFMFGGFGDNKTVDHFEYRMKTVDMGTDWISVNKQVIVLVFISRIRVLFRKTSNTCIMRIFYTLKTFRQKTFC